ncbi:MAG: matrixin family metalloprotease, partial [Myxococcota bacterium]
MRCCRNPECGSETWLKPRPQATALVVILSVLFWSEHVLAFSCLQSQCSTWCEEPDIWIAHSSAFPQLDLGMIAEQSIQEFEAVGCSLPLASIRTAEAAWSAGTQDGTSSIELLASDWIYDPGAIAITVTQTNAGTCVDESDIFVNGVHYEFSDADASTLTEGTLDLHTVLLHELGHFFGLGHSGDPSSLMYQNYSQGVGLQPDDRNGLCYLYRSEASCTAFGCPEPLECHAGACTAPDPSTQVCRACESSGECGSGSDLCVPYGGGNSYCGQACSFDGDCDPSEVCREVFGEGQCVRFFGRIPSCTVPSDRCASSTECGNEGVCKELGCAPVNQTGVALGGSCDSSESCRDGVCHQGRCSRSCDRLSEQSCPAGFVCASGPRCELGYCVAAASNLRSAGDACAEDADCTSGSCMQGTCVTLCISMGFEDSCPDGLRCMTDIEARCGTCAPLAIVGQSCQLDRDCSTGVCIALSDGLVCASPCGADAGSVDSSGADSECSAGFVCDDSPRGKICTPLSDLGRPCSTSSDCKGRCVAFEASPLCTISCTSAESCPADYY